MKFWFSFRTVAGNVLLAEKMIFLKVRSNQTTRKYPGKRLNLTHNGRIVMDWHVKTKEWTARYDFEKVKEGDAHYVHIEEPPKPEHTQSRQVSRV